VPCLAVMACDVGHVRRPDPPAVDWVGHTSGLADDHVQGNVVILPQALANDFLRYCQRNPKPCPLLAVGEPGQPLLPTLGQDIDIAPMCRATASGAMASWSTSPRHRGALA
jgi:uncharacterized protein YcsI (UPF0317 family)